MSISTGRGSGIRPIRWALAASLAAALLSACSATDALLGELAEADDDPPTQVQQDGGDAGPVGADVDDVAADAADDGDAAGGAIILPSMTIGETVYFNRMEYTVAELRVTDLDHEAETLPARVRGLRVDVDIEAFNPSDSQAGINNLSPSLTWVDPESGLAHEGWAPAATGSAVPGGGRAMLTLEYQIDADVAATFTPEAAVLRFGNESQHAALVPLGGQDEVEAKFFHYQDSMVGEAIVMDDLSWTIAEAFVGYTYDGGRLGDDQVLLEIAYIFTNDTDSQQCHHRGAGRNFELMHTATGIGTSDLGTDRCVAPGSQEQFRTGFLLPADGFTGVWELTVNQPYGTEDRAAQIDVEVVENPLSVAQWPGA